MAETQISQHITEAEALAKAREFAQALGSAPEFRAFEAARERLATDQEATTLLERFQDAQRQVAMLQTWGGIATDPTIDLERLKAEAFGHPAIKRMLDAQESLLKLFEEAAGILSAGVGIDFSGVCRPAGGCC